MVQGRNNINNKQNNDDPLTIPHNIRTARDLNASVKENLQQLLLDTSKFPKELFLVGRCINYIRAANWTHGSPIDRVSVLADSARIVVDKEKSDSTEKTKSWLLWGFSWFVWLRQGGEAYERDIASTPEVV